MKKIVFAFLVSLIVTSFATAQETEKIETGMIYFLRSTGFSGSGSAFKTFIDGKFVCKLNNKKYSIHKVVVGKHNCSVKGEKNKSGDRAEKFEVQVKAGKITYVQLNYDVGFFKGYRFYCEEVPEDIAKKKIEQMSEDTKCI
jgi:hypothetical protein